jgi:hypothetical protein
VSKPTPDEPTAEAAAAPSAAAPSPPVAGSPPPVPPAAPPPAFAPVPREPWVNPSRRGQLASIGLVAALVCLGAGIGIGVAISGDDHRDRGRQPIVMLPGRGYGPGPAIYGPRGRFGWWPVPGHPGNGGQGNGAGSAAPSPATPAAPSSTG